MQKKTYLVKSFQNDQKLRVLSWIGPIVKFAKLETQHSIEIGLTPLKQKKVEDIGTTLQVKDYLRWECEKHCVPAGILPILRIGSVFQGRRLLHTDKLYYDIADANVNSRSNLYDFNNKSHELM